MQVTADWIRERLGFVVVIHAGQIAPAIVAAELDQARADHDPKAEPAKKPEDQNWRTRFRKRPRIDQRTEKDRQEPGLEQLNLPTVTVPDIADVNDRHVNDPEQRHQN